MTGTVAVVPAAGSGERLAAGVPKAFYQLDGQTLVERAVAGLLESGVVDRVVVAVPADRTDRAKLILGRDATVVAGGANRGVHSRRCSDGSVRQRQPLDRIQVTVLQTVSYIATVADIRNQHLFCKRAGPPSALHIRSLRV